jgi:hypothetical protein
MVELAERSVSRMLATKKNGPGVSRQEVTGTAQTNPSDKGSVMLKTTPISVPKATHEFIEPIVLHMHNRYELQDALEFGGSVTAECGATATFRPGVNGPTQPGPRRTVICPLCVMARGLTPEQVERKLR